MDFFHQPEILVFMATTLVGMLCTIIGCVIWFVRLEGRVNYEAELGKQRQAIFERDLNSANERINRMKEKQEVVEEKIFDKLSSLEISVAKLVSAIEQGEPR